MLSVIRGGAKGSPTKATPEEGQPTKRIKRATTVVATALVAYGLWHYRETLASLLNKERLQQSAVQTLHRLNDLPRVSSYTAYILGMALWESVGLSTIPVETASGMVFGWPNGFWLNAVGKLLGACIAFGMGRGGILAATIEQQFAQNSFLKLVRSSTEDNPLLVAFLMKFSCLPETIKNFGSALLQPIRWWMFIMATIIHGWMFSALWTYLGVDTAARIEDVEGLLPPDRTLQTLLTLALTNGIVVSPLSMVYWVRSLQRKQAQQQPNLKTRR